MSAGDGEVALGTGASRGVGRGVALELATAGMRFHGTGRSIGQAALAREYGCIDIDGSQPQALPVFEA